MHFTKLIKFKYFNLIKFTDECHLIFIKKFFEKKKIS